MRTANPALSDKAFEGFGPITERDNTMTVQGTVNKTALLTICVVAAAFWVWNLYFSTANEAIVYPWMIGGVIGGFVVAIITIFKKTWAPMLSPVYALLEGLFIGGISAIMEAMYPGIVIQAVGLTFGVLFCMLFLYKTGIIKVTKKFMLGVVAATGAICLVYLVSIVLGFFGMSVPLIHGNGIVGIGFSLFVVGIAALNLVLDFDFIEKNSERGAPKYMEWYAAFGLMVTLVWLYIEILRLLSKLRSR